MNCSRPNSPREMFWTSPGDSHIVTFRVSFGFLPRESDTLPQVLREVYVCMHVCRYVEATYTYADEVHSPQRLST